MFGVECGTICSRDMDTGESGCSTVGGFWNVEMVKNGKKLAGWIKFHIKCWQKWKRIDR